MKHASIYCLLILFCSSGLRAQQLIFENKTVHHGLPATEVYHLYNDRQGYIWAFTEFGIVKYNGSSFIPVCRNILLKQSAVYALATAVSGELFVANSQAEIYCIRNDSAFRVEGIEQLSAEIMADNEVIASLYLDDLDNLSISTLEKTYFVARNSYRIPGAKTGSQTGAPGRDPHRLFHITFPHKEGEHFFLKILDGSGASRLSVPGRRAYYSRFPLRNNGNRIYFPVDNTKLVCRDKEILASREFGSSIICLEISDDSHIWVGLSYGGLYELDADLNVIGRYMEETTVSDILFDDQGGMWVSTTGTGIYHCSNRKKLSYSNVPELRNSITLLKILNNKLFIGTDKGDLFVKDKGILKQVDLNGNSWKIHDIIDFDGNYFIATNNEALIVDHAFGKVRPSKLPGNNYGFARNGDTLLSVGSAAIVKTIHGNSRSLVMKVNQRTRSIVRKSARSIYVSSARGMYLLLGETLSCPDYLQPLRGINICRLRMDARGNTWICTKGYGLYFLSADNRLISYRQLPSQIINDVNFIGDDIVLLSTNKGAFFNSLGTLNRKAAWISLLDQETLGIQYFRGQLYIATKYGLTALDGVRVFSQLNYQFHLRSVKAGKKHMPLRNFELSHRENDLLFNFDLLAYRFRERKLQYNLRGPVRLKGIVNGTQIHLQNLEPGYYILSVYPEMQGMKGKRKVITVPFYIRPAFWQTNLFLILVILFVVASAGFVLVMVRRKYRRRNAIEKLLYEYRLTALKSQINPHFMSNALVAIQQLILANDADGANHYLVKFSLLIRYLLSYSDKTVVSLADELKINELYIELEQLRFSSKFTFRKEIARDVNLLELFIPTLITQPLIENAVWHGLLPIHEQRQPELLLRIFTENDELHIAIRDNGAGRKPGNPAETGERESKGVLLIRNRIRTLNRLYGEREARIFYTDHTDEHQMPAGTTVTVVFPLTMLNNMYHDRNQEYHR